ncbi:hypothetical protein [Micromonospora sp. KLBMP9576]|uniref:hypothetical protein n=1 Tax=Micromonospora sp. KLBMP9576 TaxID=3424769 RepID=UPI003D8A9FD5
MQDSGYRDRLGQLVEPGERLLAYAKAEAAHGAQPAAAPDATAPQGSVRVTAGGVLLNLLAPVVTFGPGDRLVDRVCWGVAGRGAAGSVAARLHRALHPPRSPGTVRDTLIAATDQRLLVCLTGAVKLFAWRADDERSLAGTRVVFAAARTEVAAARVGWHRLNPKRLRVDFTDGSWLAFTVPIAESGRPLREVAAALSR